MTVWGMAVIKWDKKYGMRVEAKYPEDFEVDEVVSKQIYTNHEYHEEPGFLTISIGDLNVASYYTGSPTEYYVGIMLSIEEFPENYEDILADVVRQILANIRGKSFINDLPIYFTNISNYPKMSPEQKLALILLDPIKKMIIDRLIEDANVSKAELTVWIRDRFSSEYIDIDSIINSMLRNRIVREATISNMTGSVIFLIGDIFVCRVPPKRALIAAKGQSNVEGSTISNYLDHVRVFFENYSSSPEDQDDILELITNMDCNTIIRRLREGPLISSNKAYQNLKKGIKNFQEILNLLYDKQIISVQKTKKNEEAVFLLSDISVKPIYPEYVINKIRDSYYEGTKMNSVLLEHLRILQDIYDDYKKARKEFEAAEKVA